MTYKAPRWLAVAMLLAIATAAVAAPNQEAHTHGSRAPYDGYKSHDPSTHYKPAYESYKPSEYPSHYGHEGPKVGPVGPPGPVGPAGPTGPPGHPGAAGGSCKNCGLCPAGTAANFWELGEPEFALGFGLGTPNGWFDVGDLVPLALAETDCGTDLQVGGSCESFCVYVNKYKNKAAVGSFFAATFTSNGWAAEGPKAGTYCGLGNYYEFKDNKGYFFVCGAFPWKLCCRSPGYTPNIWPGPGFNGGLERSSTDMSPAITAPGQLMPLDADIIDEVIAHKTSGNKYKDQPLPAGADKLPAELPAWARQLVARKFRV